MAAALSSTPEDPGERIVSGARTSEDIELDRALRPRRFSDFPGQEKVKRNLEIQIEAARQRGEGLDHILLYGPPGLGKTTLATIVAHEMNVNIRTTSGPAVERAADLVAILTSLQPQEILFIDEIHRLSRIVEETLYPAMEDFAVDIMIGKGPSAKSLRLSLPPVTIIGATTRYGAITAPLRGRFGAVMRLEFYEPADLKVIITRSAAKLEVPLEPDGADEIACRARGTPRVANRLLRRVRDFAQVRAQGVITRAVAADALALLDVDHLGLDHVDRELLSALIQKFGGQPVGLGTLAASIGEEQETIEDVYEPFLLQLGFLNRTPRGRVATAGAYAHLGMTPPSEAPPAQPTLW
jgi:Holliday junction DNA helicase RuvB